MPVRLTDVKACEEGRPSAEFGTDAFGIELLEAVTTLSWSLRTLCI